MLIKKINDIIDASQKKYNLELERWKKENQKRIDAANFQAAEDTKRNLKIFKQMLLEKQTQNFNEAVNQAIESHKLQNQEVDKAIEYAKNQISNLIEKNEIIYGFAITSATLTAIAWAVAAYYFAVATWTFGSTIPFAIAASIQAGIMTYFTNESFNEHYGISNEINF